MAAGGQKTLFFVEKDERLKEILREKFKELGYRVLIASDPARALERFRQQPFEVLVVDCGTTGEGGVLVYERIMADAERYSIDCAGILMLNNDQKDWVRRIQARANGAVLVQPIKFKQLMGAIEQASGGSAAAE
jgi:DNA-binding response OmpR family regulator